MLVGYWDGGVVLRTDGDVRGTYIPPFVLVVAPCGLCEAVWSAPVVGRAKSRPCNGLPQARGVVVCYVSCEVGGCVLCLKRGMWWCVPLCARCVVPASQLKVLEFRTGVGCSLCLCVRGVSLAAFTNPPFSPSTWCRGSMHAGDAYEAT